MVYAMTDGQAEQGIFEEALRCSSAGERSRYLDDGSVYVVAASDGDSGDAEAMELALIKYTVTAAPGPTLEIQPSGGFVVLSWDAEFGSFQLQRNTGLDPLSWSTLVAPIRNDESRLSVTVPVDEPEAFFRLVPP